MERKGYGFITFDTPSDAQAFLDCREHFIDAKKVEAKAAVPKELGGSKLSKRLFVAGIDPSFTEDDFGHYFSSFGTLISCNIVKKADGTSRGYGFVVYQDEVSVEKCLVQYHELAGQQVEVKRAFSKEEMQKDRLNSAGPQALMPGMMMNPYMMGTNQPSAGGTSQDWTCTQCGNTNFGFRNACNRCKSLRPVDNASMLLEAQQQQMMAAMMMQQRMLGLNPMMMMGGGLMSTPYSGNDYQYNGGYLPEGGGDYSSFDTRRGRGGGRGGGRPPPRFRPY